MKKRYTIIFMGTPQFAVPSINALAKSGHHIALVVTQPDRPRGRGRRVYPPPIKTAALELGLEFTQVPSLKDPEIA